MVSQDHPFLLETVSLSKQFGSLKANHNINLAIRQGSIHALLGENGAGKSTFVKMIYGSLQPSSGYICWRGKKIKFSGPADARKLGISMVFQTFSLFESLTVLENLILALPGKNINDSFLNNIKQISADYGLSLTPEALIADLSVGERQRVEILRCLLQNPELLIMDEPTAVLTPQEADQLFIILKKLAHSGCAILYISHRLDEVKQLCDEVTVLRQGTQVAALNPQQESVQSLAACMVGQKIHQISRRVPIIVTSPKQASEISFSISHLSHKANSAFGTDLKDINLSVRKSEILAIAGVAGNGQSELFNLLSGEIAAENIGNIRYQDQNIGHWSIGKRRSQKMAFIPEERLGHASAPDLSLSENLLLTRMPDLLYRSFLGWLGFINRSQALRLKDRICQRQDVRKGKANPEANALSGGNLQKFIVGRELQANPNLLIINQPTWGVDAGAAALIRQELIDLAQKGASIIIISQDLDEIFEISHRIAVLSRGELSEVFLTDQMNSQKIGLLMSHLEKTAA